VKTPCAIGFAAALIAAANSPLADAADAEAGRKKAEACAACHGPEGNSNNPAVPSIAAQPAQFLTTALFMFREGNRKDPQMSAMAASLSNADLKDLAAYFSGRPRTLPQAREISAEAAIAGKQLTEKYNCVQCHGPSLLGQQHIPRIAGQGADYLRAQLRGFKASTRFDLDGTMTSAAQALTDSDIDTIVDYLASRK
jgi:cytochrome c553